MRLLNTKFYLSCCDSVIYELIALAPNQKHWFCRVNMNLWNNCNCTILNHIKLHNLMVALRCSALLCFALCWKWTHFQKIIIIFLCFCVFTSLQWDLWCNQMQSLFIAMPKYNFCIKFDASSCRRWACNWQHKLCLLLGLLKIEGKRDRILKGISITINWSDNPEFEGIQ